MNIPPREQLLEIYETARTIAVVGVSTNPEKDSHTVPAYLQEQGYRVIPITPRGGEILGERVFTSLAEVTEPIDIVDVFRPPEEGPEIVEAAAALGASVVWFQPETESEEATAAGTAAGLTVVPGICIRATHRLLGLGDED